MNQRTRAALALASIACATILAPAAVSATTVRKQLNIVDLLQESEIIVRGRVKSVTDGIDGRGIPYTEVTLQVSESMKGQPGREFTFRQFGLLAPRRMGDGRVNLMVTPTAWATYTKGEESIFFLRRSASLTGLRTTAGLAQGQFRITGAGATNALDNAGIFERVVIDPGLLGDAEKRVLSTTRGAVNARSFGSLVRQAVEGKWVENGRMRHADR